MSSRESRIVDFAGSTRFLVGSPDYEAACKVESNEVDLDSLIDEGYELWPGALERMACLSAVEIEFELYSEATTIWFDPSLAASQFTYIERVAVYERRANARLLPIGGITGTHLMLLLADNGAVYSAFDDYLACLGATEFEAVSNIVRAVHVEECP